MIPPRYCISFRWRDDADHMRLLQVALAYTEDTIWRNRDQFIRGQKEVVELLTKKWQKETKYKYALRSLHCLPIYDALSTCVPSDSGRNFSPGQITKLPCSFGTSSMTKRSRVGSGATV